MSSRLCFFVATLGASFLANAVTVPLSAQEAASPAAGPPEQTFLFHLGARSFDDEAWEGIDSHVLFGFEGAYHPGHAHLGLEYGLFLSTDSTDELGVEISAYTFEGSFGARYVFGDGPFFPVVGLGLSLLSAEVEGESGGLTVSDDDATYGGYGHLGVFYRTGSRFIFGLDARIASTADVELFGVDGDGSYSQLSLLLGWGK